TRIRHTTAGPAEGELARAGVAGRATARTFEVLLEAGIFALRIVQEKRSVERAESHCRRAREGGSSRRDGCRSRREDRCDPGGGLRGIRLRGERRRAKSEHQG